MTCPSDDGLSAYVEGRVPAMQRAALRTHLRGCESCADLVAAYVEAWSMSPQTVSDPSGPATVEIACPPSLGRYRIRRRIGAGGMGEVFEAFDPQLERPLAIKRLRVGDASAMAREARFAALLRDPHVVEIYDVVHISGESLILMEYVEGQTLAAWMRADRSPTEILDVFRQAALGLAAAHDAGVVHRDFKPHNVLVGDDGRVRITDFGLARWLGEARPGSGGTRLYTAVEQVLGADPQPASDQYSYCCSLVEAITRIRPERTSQWRALARSIPRHWSGRNGRKLAAVLERGLCARPKDRWPSMRALLQALPTSSRGGVSGLAGLAGLAGAIGVVVTGLVLASPSATPPVATSGLSGARAVAGTIGRTELARGRGLIGQRRTAGGHRHLEVAVQAASVAADDTTLADAALVLMLDAINRQDLARARRWHRHADASIERIPDDGRRGLALRAYEAALLALEGRHEPAIAQALEVVDELQTQELDSDVRAMYLEVLATTLLQAGRFEDAEPIARSAFELTASDEPVNRLAAMRNLAVACSGVGKSQESIDLARRMVALARAAYGGEAPTTVHARGFLGSVLADAGMDDEAEPVLVDAIEQMRRRAAVDPTEQLGMAAALTARLAQVQRRRGDLDAAVGTHLSALESLRSSLPAGHPYLAWAQRGLAEALLAAGRRADALDVAWQSTDAVDALSRTSGHELIAQIYEDSAQPELAMVHFHIAALWAASQPGPSDSPESYLAAARRVVTGAGA